MKTSVKLGNGATFAFEGTAEQFDQAVKSAFPKPKKKSGCERLLQVLSDGHHPLAQGALPFGLDGA